MGPSASSRRVAWELLRAVWQDGAYANIAWPTILGSSQLTGADRGFATELAYGSLRHYGQWSQVLERAGNRSQDRVDDEVWWVLVLGTHQLLSLQTPAHAAVNESVELCREVGKKSATGLVNAVLRKVAAHDLDQWRELLAAGVADPVAKEAVRGAHPEWIASLLHEALEREGCGGELPQLLSAHNTPARVTLAVINGEPGPTRTPFSPLGEYVDGAPGDDQRVRDGSARVQDEGSQLAALVASGLGLPADALVVDACAGPGGKTAVLSRHFSRVIALEQHEHRSELVRQATASAAHPVAVHTVDAREYFRAHPAQADLVVLDAPCLGLGALRRRPEARWIKTPGDLEDLVEAQRELLRAAVSGLQPGGFCLYITCSPVVAETTEQVAWICREVPQLRRLDTGPIVNQVARETVSDSALGSAVQLWPHRHGTDAMFIQVLQLDA